MLRHIRRLSITRVNAKTLYSNTLQLPKTEFGPKVPSGSSKDELIKLVSEDLYSWQLNRENYNDRWIFHDGPPYANGDLHLGHALNKILKDIINRFELIRYNNKVIYQPGWDCHGLPIEMKAISNSEKASELQPTEVRSLCRRLAMSMIDKQRDQFKEFGIMTDFNNPYITLSNDYEIKQLQVFLKLMENGLLSRQLKPVWWGCETQTALAEAELEYNNAHNSVATYVKFPLASSQFYKLLNEKYPFIEVNKYDVQFLIWTSTAWTIPANQAICIHRDLNYTLIYNDMTNEHLIVAESLADELCKLNESYRRYSEPLCFKGDELLNLEYINPAVGPEYLFPILHGDHVSATAGSGLVHTAPAHGGEDYLIGCRHNLKIMSSVNGQGMFIADNIPDGFSSLKGEYANKKEGLWKCIDIMKEHNMIFHINKKYKHSYPYDWRSNKPVIQRATPQWFVNVEKIKPTAIEALESVEFLPENGKNRLKLFINNRNEWCISRQRTWGVPLPIIFHKESGEPIDDIEVIRFTIKCMTKFGTDSWFTKEDDICRWLPESYKDMGTMYVKGQDTMDVWFDSGTSWSTLGDNMEELSRSDTPLADIYLEGSDQHRGWFQSSLLNKIIASGVNGENFKPVAPFKKIVTHGFTLDSKNDKMSKSKGNVISPKHAINGGGKPFLPSLGTDGLRLWVASSNFTQDVNVSSEILTRVFENVKKLRVTLKYMLGNLNDFEENKKVSYNDLNPLDKLVLSKLFRLQQTCVEYYKDHNFSRVVKDISTHMSVDLSAQYFDISKDCLYTDAKDSKRRRSIQTVLQALLRTYIGLLAPIQPLLVQEVWNVCPEYFKNNSKSPFTVGSWDFYQIPDTYLQESIEHDFSKIWQVKDTLYKSLEELRLNGTFKNKLETQVNIVVDNESSLGKLLTSHQVFLDDYFLVSKVYVNEEPLKEASYFSETSLTIDEQEVKIQIAPSSNAKCPRCWKFVSESEDALCTKCDTVVHKH